MAQFKNIIRQDLHQYLLAMNEVDEHLPECPDVEEKWEEIAKDYLLDGILTDFGIFVLIYLVIFKVSVVVNRWVSEYAE